MTAPTRIRLHKKSGLLELEFDGQCWQLPAEFLRVYSPSAEVKGHGKGQAVLQAGKREVQLTGLEPAGNYAIRLIFDDGHDSGIYSWSYLADLCRNQQTHWEDYLQRLDKAGLSREAHTATIRFIQPD